MKPRHENAQQRNTWRDLKKATKGEATVSQEYVVGWLMHHMDTPQGGR